MKDTACFAVGTSAYSTQIGMEYRTVVGIAAASTAINSFQLNTVLYARKIQCLAVLGETEITSDFGT